MVGQVIKVVPANQVFSINWFLGPRCNYDCMYCPEKWHSTTSKHLTQDELKNIWLSVYDKSKHLGLKYKIVFTGGEVTSNKHLMPFLEWLRSEYSTAIDQILLTTNGSATLKYYTKLFTLVDNISFSVHSEFVDEKKFFTMVAKLKNQLAEKNFLHVNIMNEFWNQDRIPLYEQYLKLHDISHSVNEVDYTMQTRINPMPVRKHNFEF